MCTNIKKRFLGQIYKTSYTSFTSTHLSIIFMIILCKESFGTQIKSIKFTFNN